MISKPEVQSFVPYRLHILATLLAAALSSLDESRANPQEDVQPAAVESIALTMSAETVLPSGASTYSIPFSKLSSQSSLPLKGVDGINGLDFSQRLDQIVIGARLNLDYTYSQSMLPDLSHLKVILNGAVAESIALPKETAAKPKQSGVSLPVQNLREFNRLDLQLIGHYTMGCENPFHSSLWANVAGNSTVELTVLPADLLNDLALLPAPFFDGHDVRELNLPVVLGLKPDAGRLESAGIVTSWFGALAGYRGARFSASLQDLPVKGNGVVLLQTGENIPGLQIPDVQGPTLAMVTNPRDSHGKLLLVMGRDAKELRQAAIALTLGNQTLAGSVAHITKVEVLEPRKPFDAPNWLRSDRPVRFGELVDARSLDVSGRRPAPININLRMPPGLFGWHSNGIPVDLKYRYSPRPGTKQSTLEMIAGDRLMRSFPLGDGGPGIFRKFKGIPVSEGEEKIMVPTYLLPAMGALQFRYIYEYLDEGECKTNVIDSARSAIDPDSTIDISALPKYASMPDLALFADAGFPFTRMADLSESAVVLPDGANVSDYSVYLTLMGTMGQATGYPSTEVTVATAAQAAGLGDKDLLVLASGDNQPLLKQWSKELPSDSDGNSLKLRLSNWASGVANKLGNDSHNRAVQTDVSLGYEKKDGTFASLMGMQSPLKSGRSVVVLSGSNGGGLNAAVNALLANRDLGSQSNELQNRIGGNLTVVSGDKVTTVLDEQDYYVGTLPAWLNLQWFFARHPLLLVGALVFSALVIAALLYLSLRARAQRRLGA